jgi:hypothetical protein
VASKAVAAHLKTAAHGVNGLAVYQIPDVPPLATAADAPAADAPAADAPAVDDGSASDDGHDDHAH